MGVKKVESERKRPGKGTGGGRGAGGPGGYDLSILRALRRIMRAVDIHSKRLTLRHGITAPQLLCLLTVRDLGPVTATTIAGEMHVSTSTLVGILDRLETKGLVVRERGTADRRLVYVSVTPGGRRLAEAAPSPLQETLVDGLGRLPAAELKTMAGSLERIVELMEAEDLSAAPLLDTLPVDAPGAGTRRATGRKKP